MNIKGIFLILTCSAILFLGCERRTNPFDSGGDNYDPPVYKAAFNLKREYLGNTVLAPGSLYYNFSGEQKTKPFPGVGKIEIADTLISSEKTQYLFLDSIVLSGFPVARFQHKIYSSTLSGSEFDIEVKAFDTIAIQIGMDSLYLNNPFFIELDSCTKAKCFFNPYFYKIELDTSMVRGIVAKHLFRPDSILFKYFPVQPNPFSYKNDIFLNVTMSMRGADMEDEKWEWKLDSSFYYDTFKDSLNQTDTTGANSEIKENIRSFYTKNAITWSSDTVSDIGMATSFENDILSIPFSLEFDGNQTFTPLNVNNRLIYTWNPKTSDGNSFEMGSYFFISYSDSIFVAEKIIILP
ncbi:MAG: hypothetical protein ABIA63_06550 [bacterium]